MAHSFDRFWSRERLARRQEPESKKAGKPGWEWTPSRERQMFRLVAKGNVPWKHIATAMYEPAAPGKKEFAPCKSACRTHWYKMTDMKPREAYIRNRFRRKKQREQLERAFEQYQQRQYQCRPSAPVLSESIGGHDPHSMLESVLDIPFESSGSHTTNTSAPSPEQHGDAPDIRSPPLLTLEGTTPADSVLSVPTPLPQEMQRAFAHDEMRTPKQSIESPVRAGAPGFPQSKPTVSRKRPAPLEFHEAINRPLRGLFNRRPTVSSENELACVRRNSKSDLPHESAKSCSSRQMTGLSSVQEEPEIGTTSKMTIAELEDEMKYPRGFIAFIKYGLTKSRLSVQSMVSASGTIRSRFSSRRSSRSSVRSGKPQDSIPFAYASYLSNRNRLPPALQPSPPIDCRTGRQLTSVFMELRVAGASDNEVARRLRALLQDVGPDMAQHITGLRSGLGETALEVALALGNIPACRVLLDAGADVHARTSDGKSLAEFGRLAMSQANNNALYFAIGACRNEILSHPQGLRETAKANIDADSNDQAQLEDTSQLGHANERHSDARTADTAAVLLNNPNRIRESSLNDTMQQASVGMPLNGDGIVSGSGPTSASMEAFEPSASGPGPLSSQQIPTLSVPGLVAYFNAVDSQHHRLDGPLRARGGVSARPRPIILPNFKGLPGLNSSTSLVSGSTTLDNPSVARNTSYESISSGIQMISETSYPHYELLPELLPDRPMAYILPVVPGAQNLSASASAPLVLGSQVQDVQGNPRPSKSLAQPRDSTNHIEDCRPMMSGSIFQPPIPVPVLNNDIPIIHQAPYPDDCQLPCFQDSDPAMNNTVPNMIPTYTIQPIERHAQQASSVHDSLTIPSGNHISDTQPYQNTLFDPALEEIFWDSMLPGIKTTESQNQQASSIYDMPTIQSRYHIPEPQLYQPSLFDPELDDVFNSMLPLLDDTSVGNSFVPDWDSYPSSLQE